MVDFGTATTFDAITAKGEYLGGAIAPGIGIAAEALLTRTAKLPPVDLRLPPSVIGRNTVHAIQSGLVYGYIAMMEGMVARYRAELGEGMKVIATGGLAEIDRQRDESDPDHRSLAHPGRPAHPLGAQQVNMPNPLKDKTILLGVSGSIAAYKAAELASRLTQAGARVDVILTQAATQFITPLTFQSVTGRKAFTDTDLWGGEGHVTHIALGRAADLLLIAPATANTLARLAHGLADNLLSVSALAAHCPLLLAPAMDAGMYSHPATQANVEILRSRGATLIGPAAGHLASGLVGVGRMVEPAEIVDQARLVLARSGPLAGRKVVVTAGGTREAIDPVREIANRSSGKQGFALAQAALDAGAQVTLVSAPAPLPTPSGARRRDVRTAAEMLSAVLDEVQDADALLMAAAVADFRPSRAADHKLKKAGGVPQIHLEETEDILAAVSRQRQEKGSPRVTVGFAAESQDLLENARAKLRNKGLELIVANDISATDAGFEADTNRVTLLFADGSQKDLPLLSKAEVAEAVIEQVVRLLKQLSA